MFEKKEINFGLGGFTTIDRRDRARIMWSHWGEGGLHRYAMLSHVAGGRRSRYIHMDFTETFLSNVLYIF